MSSNAGVNRVVAAVAVLVTLGCSGCGGSAPPVARPPAGIQHEVLHTSDGPRTYRLFVPTGLAQHQVPLLLVLQGCGPIHNGDDMAKLTGLDARASTDGFIAVYPDVQGTCWNIGIGPSSPNDVAFIRALIEKISGTYPVDRSRVYATGVSGGGLLAHLLACRMADQLAAIASVAGNMPVSHCSPGRPISVLELHGTEDPYVSFAGVPDLGIPSVTQTMQQWAKLDACGSPSQSQTGIVITTIWPGCARGARVELLAVQGGHHVWFGSACGPCKSVEVPGEPDANAVVLGFLGLAK